MQKKGWSSGETEVVFVLGWKEGEISYLKECQWKVDGNGTSGKMKEPRGGINNDVELLPEPGKLSRA